MPENEAGAAADCHISNKKNMAN